jgi:hypothetical protein
MTFAANLEDTDAGKFAAEGSAAHELASRALTAPTLTEPKDYIGQQIQIGERVFTVDESMADYVTVYTRYVRDRAGTKGHILVEQSVDLSERLGADAGGTMDAGIALPGEFDAIDLKYGMGERVFAAQYYATEPVGEFSFHMGVTKTDTDRPWCVPNYQLMMYALGGFDLLEMFGPFTHANLTIVQPRLDHIDSVRVPLHVLEGFGLYARERIATASAIMAANAAAGPLLVYFNPGTKQCRWCKAKTECPALAAKVQADVGAEFASMAAENLSPISAQNADIVAKYAVLSLIEDWCRAVRSEVQTRVMRGDQLIGPDGLAMKMVQGAEGKRQWLNEKAAEQALIGQLPIDKAYAPARIITAPAAAKLLDKAKTKTLWADFFVPLIGKTRGAPAVAWGSDERPTYVASATADEFKVGEADATAE